MKPSEKKQLLDNAILFMNRSRLEGHEALAFSQVMAYLKSERAEAEAEEQAGTNEDA